MIIIKTQKEIDSMRRGGKILAEIMSEIGKSIAPGKNTLELDELAERLVFDNGGTPAFKGYGDKTNPFPATICSSINNEIVHGIPSVEKIIKAGDIVKIDMGIKYEGMITDMARTFPAGEISDEASRIMKATREGLNTGIAKIKAGAKMSEYSMAVENYVKTFGFSVVRDLVGHGVGRFLHEDPQIPNYYWKGKDIVFKEGMTIALEPMVNVGTYRIKLGSDGWVYETQDKKLSAHFEDTVVVRKGGCEILTR
jgi:methionyl aminopeptidase